MITALLLVVLCGFVALAIDLGTVRLTEAQLQAVTDGAAIAGTMKLRRPGVTLTVPRCREVEPDRGQMSRS